MKRKLFLTSILLLCTFSHATMKEIQTPKEIIKKAIRKIKSYKTINISAKYSLVNKEENISHELVSNLKLKGDKYRLKFMGIERIFDGRSIYTIDPEAKEVTISKPKGKNQDDDTIVSPTELLTFFEKGFDYKWAKIEEMESRLLFVIQLIATKNVDFKNKKIFLGIDKKTFLPKKFILKPNEKTVIEVLLTSFVHDLPIAEKNFRFDKEEYDAYFISKE